MAIKVLIVDDQALVRAGFRMILEAQPDLEVVGEAGDGSAAIDAVRTLRPDVVLMDIRMPGVDGIEATRRLTEAGAAGKIVILTTYDLDEYVFDALAAGASGFLLKHVPPGSSCTASAWRQVARRSSRLPSRNGSSRSSL